MENEAATRLDRPAMMDWDIWRLARIDVELAEHAAEADFGALGADADPDRPLFIMDADQDDRAFEPRVGHSGHGQEQFARQEARILHILRTMTRRVRRGKP